MDVMNKVACVTHYISCRIDPAFGMSRRDFDNDVIPVGQSGDYSSFTTFNAT